jgi:hypothetical protein
MRHDHDITDYDQSQRPLNLARTKGMIITVITSAMTCKKMILAKMDLNEITPPFPRI